MRKILLLSGLLLLSYTQIHSQVKTEYGYDSAGNRIKREVIYLTKKQKAIEVEKETTPIQKKITEGSIMIYPNPTKGELSAELVDFKEIKSGELRIFDVQGKLILKKDITTEKESINISSSPNGIYIMIITIDDKNYQWKIIKE